MSEATKKIYVELEWEKKMRCTEVICIEIPAWVEGTDQEIYDKYRDALLCDVNSTIEAPSQYSGDWSSVWGEDLDDDRLLDAAPRHKVASVTPDWVTFERPAVNGDVEVDTFDPVLAGQRSLLDMLGGQ